jgi:spore germination protein
MKHTNLKRKNKETLINKFVRGEEMARKIAPDQIDPRVIPLLFLLSIVEFKLLFLARKILLIAGRDSWLAALLGGIIVTLSTYFLFKLINRFPKQNFFQYLPRVWGKPLALLLCTGYFFFWASFLTLLFTNTIEVNKMFFLKKTPELIPIILLAIGAIWLVSYGFAAITRFIQIISPLYIIPVIIVVPLTLGEIDFDHFSPVLANGIMPVIKGAIIYSGYFHGLEVILFLSPFLAQTTGAFKPTLGGIILLNLLAFFFIGLAIGVLGIQNVNEILWPGFSMLSIIEIPGFPAERFELLFTLPLLIGVFVAISLTLYLLSFGISQVFKICRRKAVIYITSFCSVFATLLIPNFAWSIYLRDLHTYIAIIFIYCLPLLTLLLAVLRKKENYS